MPQRRFDQFHHFLNNLAQPARRALQRQICLRRCLGSGQELFQIFFGQCQLPQGDIETFPIHSALPRMQLHRHQRPGHVVSQVMCQPAGKLAQERKPFAAADGFFHFGQLTGQRFTSAARSRISSSRSGSGIGA